VDNLMRNTRPTALLVLRVENQVSVVEQPVQVVIHMQPLPPRVVFEPEATRDTPAWAGIAHRGMPTSVVVTPRNYGDEELVPLSARIAAKDNAASAKPGQFRANEPITLAIDTSSRPCGEKYTVPFSIDTL